ncbi:F0F1 ATP synthase subunit B [Paenibacillus sp. SEL3]|uniref:ATP synthase subunit b n=2 Tax=Paenibacillus TaxID=44249 RepID=A0A074LY15_PAEPO|nr:MULTISPECIES: F0F1 ATP synthase subunit B [Paenibacillus]KAF6634807.1 F0F1 ATP synthase subunit B [Paenibacillus sp. EKM208P]MCF2716197.1 F0F1 ATP synthase subunit B [Paenibacillus sp. UKAQ_18]AIW41999.1 ATP synthase F0F1 subunit B [Paenibacillus polymyxa CR1]AJW69347.1 F0F1 ATP synthase subunit B [Paenibacillus polymyxa E681]ALA44248.1 ATP synthase F0F1 subunit B [Paenibacillus peoriae]
MSLNWTSIVFTIIAFLILYWLLTRYAFGPLFSVMEKRRQLVLQQMNEAAQTREQAAAYVEEQKQALQQARKEAYDIIEQSKQTGNKQAEQIIVQAKDEAVRLKDEAVREITSERNKAVAELRSEVGKASVQIASKLIQKEIKEDQVQGELVDQYLKEVGGKA